MFPHRRRSPRAASTRSAGRWVGLGASALFVGSVLLVTPSAVPVASATDCPNTKIVLGGYSQGASVVDIVAGVSMGGIKWGSALPPEYANNVTAVATFGDVADRAGGSLPTQSALFGSKAIDLCNPNDPICHAGPGNEWSGHTEGYIPVYTTQAAAFVASELLAGSGQKVPGYDPPQGFGPQPGYGPQTPGYDPSINGPASPSPVLGLVSAVH